MEITIWSHAKTPVKAPPMPIASHSIFGQLPAPFQGERSPVQTEQQSQRQRRVPLHLLRRSGVVTRGSTRYQRSRRPRARVDEHAAGPRRHPALVRSESLRGLNPRFLDSPVQEPTVRARLRPELLGQPPVGRLHLFGTRKKQPQASCGTGRERAAAQRGQIEPGGGD